MKMSLKETVLSVLNEIKSLGKTSSIGISTTSNFQIWMNRSRFITSGYAHIYVRLKVLSVPSSAADINAISLPSGLTISDNGMVTTAFASNGEWTAPNTGIYAYVSPTGIVVHKAEISAGNYITFDHIVRVVGGVARNILKALQSLSFKGVMA